MQASFKEPGLELLPKVGQRGRGAEVEGVPGFGGEKREGSSSYAA